MNSVSHPIHAVSNPIIVKQRYMLLYNPTTPLFISNQKNKKYSVINPSTGEIVSFGDIRYSDFTKHGDNMRRLAYHQRFRMRERIPNKTDEDPYSPYMLSKNLLW